MSIAKFGQIALFGLGAIALWGAIDIAFIGGNGLSNYNPSARATDMVTAVLSVATAGLSFYLGNLNGQEHDQARSELRLNLN